MNEEFKIGDMVECHRSSPHWYTVFGTTMDGPEPGDVLRVKSILYFPHDVVGLCFDPFFTPFTSDAFKKIDPEPVCHELLEFLSSKKV